MAKKRKAWSELAEAGYRDSHRRVSQRRGRARDLTCVKCGVPARQWALVEKLARANGSYREGKQVIGGTRTVWCRWSLDPDCYVPLCMTCHVHLDNSNHPKAGTGRGRKAGPPRTHCRRGHELTPDNLYRNGKRGSICRECSRERKSRYRSEARKVTCEAEGCDYPRRPASTLCNWHANHGVGATMSETSRRKSEGQRAHLARRGVAS